MTPDSRRTRRVPRGLSFLVSLAAVLATTACPSSGPAVDVAAEESTVRQLTLEWAAAEASNNIDSAMSFLWEDAIMQPPNATQIQGHAAIRALYQTVTFVSLEVGPTTVRVSASGDLAVVWGPLTAVLQGPAGPITDHGKFVAVWQRRDGKWKAIENSWSSDAPAPLPPR